MDEVPEPGRPLFDSLPPEMVVLFYVMAAMAVSVFAFGIWKRAAKYRRGRPARELGEFWRRVLESLATVGLHTRLIRRNPVVGLSHGLIFFGFAALFVGTTIITIDHDVMRLISPSLQFWRGEFYKWFSLSLDLFGLAMVVGLAVMAVRRWGVRPSRLDYRRPDRADAESDRRAYRHDDLLFAGLLIAIAVTGFQNEALRILMHRPPFEVWSVVGWSLADAIEGAGVTRANAASWYPYMWWVHAVLALAFIAYLPYAKSVHMLLAAVSLFLRDKDAGRRLPAVPEEQGAVGYGSIKDFSWAELVQLDACTKCGRCQNACPAYAGGWPLSPRDVILELRENAEATFGPTGLFRDTSGTTQSDFGVLSDTLWSCTTCMACVEACPVGIQHVPMIVQMRRRLVEEGRFESNVQATLEKVAQYGNSFGAPEKERGNWTEELDFEIKDARVTQVDCLWFVGDVASFDPRIRQITLSAARVFRATNLDFGILYDGEVNAGNDVRRIGEEGLYAYLVEQNSSALAGARFKRIVTTDPHSYNTLKREYPDLDCEVLHHTELLSELFEQGRLQIAKPLGRRVTYHDPCHLSRYNQVIDAPRKLLRALGLDLVEMERHGANSFCCGAGGGRIWMTSRGSRERPSEQRIREAVGLDGVEQFVTACPKCFSMHSEAVKATNNDDHLQVIDVIQLVEEALARA